QRGGDGEVTGAPLDGGGRRGSTLGLLQRARERQRIARELGAHGVGQVLAFPAHRQCENLSDDGGEEPGDDPDHEQDQEYRSSAPLLSSPSPSPPPPTPPTLTPTPPSAPPPGP